MERKKFIDIVSFDEEAKHEHFLEVAPGLGGRVLSQVVNLELFPEWDEVDRETFTQMATDKGLAKNKATLIWQAGASMQNDELYPDMSHKQRPPVNLLNLNAVRSQLKKTEIAARPLAHGLGKRGWDMFAEMINNRFGASPDRPQILPWDKDIHTRFVGASSQQRRDKAALALKARYNTLPPPPSTIVQSNTRGH